MLENISDTVLGLLLFYLTWICMMQDPKYFMLKEDVTPCIFGPVEKQRWSYACAKQMTDRLIYGTQ